MLQRDVETAKEKSVHESSDVIFYGEQGNPDMDIDRDLDLDLHGDRGIACFFECVYATFIRGRPSLNVCILVDSP